MRSRSSNNILSILILLFVAVLLTFSIQLVRDKLMRNTQEMGMSLAHSYAMETELQLDDYRQAFDLAADYVEELHLSGDDPAAVQAWLKDYSNKLDKLFGTHVVDLYAVIGGKIVAANPWTGDSDYDYASTSWYRTAQENRGKTIYSDVYVDAITDASIFTISKELEHHGDVLAMDVYIENGNITNVAQSMPESYSFYLCDSQGQLLYAILKEKVDKATLQSYADALMAGIEDGSLFAYDATIRSFDGTQRGVYYAEMNNDWTVIMTIPTKEILMGEQSVVIYSLTALGILLYLILMVMVIRDFRQRKRIDSDGSTIRILSDSFFAIYRVNFHTGTYAAIKLSPDLSVDLPKQGGYELLLNRIKKLVHPDTYQEFELNFSLKSIRQRVAEHVPDYGGDYQRRFGTVYKWVNVRTIYDEATDPNEVVLCFRDVDIEKRQQLQHTIILKEALDTAKKSSKAKSDFFSKMSHDMRTPLNAIIGFSKLAQQDQDDKEKIQDYMKKIEFSGSQLLILINDILEMSKMEAGKSVLDIKQFDLREYIEDTAGIFKAQAAQSNKDFSIQLDIRDPLVKGDAFKIGQILNNLLSNAFKYSEDGAKIRLEVRQFDFQKHSKYQFIVSDTGIGMSEEFLSHIFDPYSRETHFSARVTVGTGLGMPIVKSLVQQMSGEINVESRLGQGSRFTVTIPLEVVEDALPAAAEREPDPHPGFDLSGRRILVAEDNALNMEITTEILNMSGVEVLQAVNGAEAVQIFQAAAPYSIDAILMDMQMPVMDGCEAAQAIRALSKPDAATVPIIAVTANAFAEDIDKTTNAGMNGHVSKPIDLVLLHQTLERLLK